MFLLLYSLMFCNHSGCRFTVGSFELLITAYNYRCGRKPAGETFVKRPLFALRCVSPTLRPVSPTGWKRGRRLELKQNQTFPKVSRYLFIVSFQQINTFTGTWLSKRCPVSVTRKTLSIPAPNSFSKTIFGSRAKVIPG